MTPAEAAAILRQFNDWRRGNEDIPQPDPREIGEAIDAAVEMIERLEDAEKSADWHKRRWMALQMHQTKMREPERTMVCDIIANGELMHPTVAGDRYYRSVMSWLTAWSARRSAQSKMANTTK